MTPLEWIIVFALLLVLVAVILSICFIPTNSVVIVKNDTSSEIIKEEFSSDNAILSSNKPQLLVSSDVFPSPTILTQPGFSRFADFVFIHDAGFICLSTLFEQTPGIFVTKMLLYQVTNDGINKLATELTLPTALLAGGTASLCNGCFMSSLGVLDEVYYLVLVLGIQDLALENKFGRELHVYYYDTDSDHSNANIWTKSTVILQHPYFGTDLNPRPPSSPFYVGCFGNAIQSLVDQTTIGTSRQSLYVSGTEFNSLSAARPQPSAGGMVFQYLFLSNTINPVISLQFTIQDAKLLLISTNPTTPVPVPLLSDFDYYMRGFGSVFTVNATTLAISNLTNQDTVSNPCDAVANLSARIGYVQVFTLINGIWTQEYVTCSNDPSIGKQIYVNRIVPVDVLGPIGFGAGLLIIDNFLFINTSNNLTSVYNLATGHKPSPVPLEPWSLVSTTSLSSTNTFPGAVFNRLLLNINGNLVVVSYDLNPSVDVIAIFQTTNSSTSTTTTPIPDIFESFKLLQTIGKTTNSGSSVESLIGFAQFTQSCQSPNRLKTFLFVNDPIGQRVFIYQA
jgi:hypothetical protein